MPRHAWQPFTPRGVAAFAGATFARVLFAQLLAAAIVAVSLLWFLSAAWVPVVTEAIQHLPDTGSIRRGELDFAGESPRRLAENPRLAIVVDVAGARDAGQIAELEVVFEKTRVVLRGPLGVWWQPYEPGYVINFNRPQLAPWWGAWRWAMLALVALATVVSLCVMWWSLALLYVPLVKVIAFFADRAVTRGGAWRLGAAALLPGSCLVALALALHGFGAVDFFRFGLLYLLHVVVGFLFVVTSPFFLPKLQAVAEVKNPFTSSDRP